MLTPLALPVSKKPYGCERGHHATYFVTGRFFEADDLPTISAEHLQTAVHNEEQLVALETAELKEPVTVWMKLDTGMHRLGVLPEQAEAFYQRLSQCKNVRQPVNIVSHFARADEPQSGATEKQLDIFNTFVKVNRGNAQLRHQAAFCYGRSRILTGRVRGSFFTVSRRWKMARPGRILVVSQSCL